jgi:hypothetical protein
MLTYNTNNPSNRRFEVSTGVTMKNAVFWYATLYGSCVRPDVSAELRASIIRVTIGELGTTLAATSNRRALWGAVASYS